MRMMEILVRECNLEGCTMKDCKREVCKRDENGWTPLHHAAVNGHLDAIRWLVETVAGQPEHQAPWDQTTHYKAAIDHCSAKRSACYSGDTEDGDSQSASPYATMSVLFAALTARQVAAMELLLELGADINEVVTECGSTLLLVSCHEGKAGYLEDVRMLLQHGADVHAKDWEGMTPLHKAMRPTQNSVEEELEVVRLLIDTGAKVDAVSYTHQSTPGTSLLDGNTPLHCAAVHGDCVVARMRLLVHHGADVNARTPVFGMTPLHLAACLGGKKAVRVLMVELGADIDVKCDEENTARDLASRRGYHDIVRALDEHSAGRQSIIHVGLQPTRSWSPTNSYKAAIDLCSAPLSAPLRSAQCSGSYTVDTLGIGRTVSLPESSTYSRMPALFAALTVRQVAADWETGGRWLPERELPVEKGARNRPPILGPFSYEIKNTKKEPEGRMENGGAIDIERSASDPQSICSYIERSPSHQQSIDSYIERSPSHQQSIDSYIERSPSHQ